MPDGGFDIEGMLSAASQGKLGGAPSAAQSYPWVATHPAPDDSGGYTNLSDADYAKLMAGQASPGSPSLSAGRPDATITVTAPSGKNAAAVLSGLRASQQTGGDAQPFDVEHVLTQAAAGSLPDTRAPEQPPPHEDFLPALAGSMAAALDALPRGVIGNATDYLNAATQTPIRMATGLQGPLSAFNEGLTSERSLHQQLASRYPIASIGAQLMGGAAAGYGAAPALGYEAASAAAPFLSRIGNVADYLGRNAAFGGASSWMTGGDPTTGALIGGGLAGVAPAVGAALRAPGIAYRQFAPLWSGAAGQNSVANTLQRDLAGASIATSPTGPLDLAQATGNPLLAAKVRYAEGAFPAAAQPLRAAQAGAARGQIAQIGAPASAADASAAGTNAIRDLAQATRQREGELWNSPLLTDFMLGTRGVKESAQSALNAIQRDDPGLMLGMTGNIRQAITGIGKLPDSANLQNINSFIGALKAVARRPPPENARAGALASRIVDSLEKGLDTTVSASGAPSGVQSAYQAARAFTRERATVLGTQDMRKVLERNPSGLFVADPSEGLQRFFNLSNGSPEGPENIQQLIDFADGVKGALLGRGSRAIAIGDARDQLKNAARAYVAQALTEAGKLGEGQNFNPKTLQDFLRTNATWMQRSGLFQSAQLSAASKLMDYATALRRTEGLGTQSGSPTQARQEMAKTFIDQIMAPWTRKLLEFTALGVGGSAHGGVGAVIGGIAGAKFESAVRGAENAMRDMMAEAMFDPEVAKGLTMRATAGNERFMTPRVRAIIERLRLGIGSDAAPQYFGASKVPSPAQPGQ